MYEAAPRILNGSGTVWDYLAFLPAAGYMAGRLSQACFVGETEIATGWGSVHYASAALPLAGDAIGTEAAWLDDWNLDYALLGASILVLTAVYARKRKTQQDELDHLFATAIPEDLRDDPHVSLPPPEEADASGHSPEVGWALLPCDYPSLQIVDELSICGFPEKSRDVELGAAIGKFTKHTGINWKSWWIGPGTSNPIRLRC